MKLLVTGRKAINMQILILSSILQGFPLSLLEFWQPLPITDVVHLCQYQCHHYVLVVVEGGGSDLFFSLYPNFRISAPICMIEVQVKP
jgi:hypothetical protein